MKKKLVIYCIILITPITIFYSVALGNNNILLKTSYDTDYSVGYNNIPFSLYIDYRIKDFVNMGFAFGKGSGEGGYYPGGVFNARILNIYETGGFYIELTQLEQLRTLILGNYIPVIGLGVLFGKPFPLLLGIPYLELARIGNYLKPVASTSKSMVLEGIGLDYVFNDYSIKLFFSWNRFDSSCGDSNFYKYNDNDWDGIANDEDSDDFTGYEGKWNYNYSSKTELFSSIRGDGDYTEEFGLDNRNNLRENIFGINVSRENDNLLYGVTYVYSYFNRLVDPYYNFDPYGGDKTGYYFRGDWYMNSSFYFKKNGLMETFGELVTSYYRSKSYYEDFNGNNIFSAGVAGGLRKRIGRTGVLLWGVYLPPMLINPHCQEYPEGERNHYMVLLDTVWYRGVKKFDFWTYIYSEIYEKDDPGSEERGFCMNLKIQYPLIWKLRFSFNQKLDITDNYYYAPGVLSYRMIGKLAFKKAVSNYIFTGLRMEMRYGSPEYEKVNKGYYFGPEASFKNESLSVGGSLYYYNADNSHFSYVYPYRDRLFKWSFLPYGIYGKGLMGSLQATVYNLKGFDLGLKIEQRIDFSNSSKDDTSFFVITNYSF